LMWTLGRTLHRRRLHSRTKVPLLRRLFRAVCTCPVLECSGVLWPFRGVSTILGLAVLAPGTHLIEGSVSQHLPALLGLVVVRAKYRAVVSPRGHIIFLYLYFIEATPSSGWACVSASPGRPLRVVQRP